MGENNFAKLPVAFYGMVLWMSGLASYTLSRQMILLHGSDSVLADAIGRDEKGVRSLYGYSLAIPLAFFAPAASMILYAAVAIMWLIPDRRIEDKINKAHTHHE